MAKYLFGIIYFLFCLFLGFFPGQPLEGMAYLHIDIIHAFGPLMAAVSGGIFMGDFLIIAN